MNQSARYYLQKLKNKYLYMRLGENFLVAMAGMLLLKNILLTTNISESVSFFLTLAAFFVIETILHISLKLHRLDERRVITFINRQYPALQQSTDLLLKGDTELTSLQQLQKERITEEFKAIYPGIRFPHRLGRAALFFGFSALITVLLSSFVHKPNGIFQDISTISQPNKKDNSTTLPAAIKSIRIRIQPPAYTGIPLSYSDDPHLTIPEGSNVQWDIAFTDEIKGASLIFSGGEKEELRDSKTQRSFSKSTFYQVGWTPNEGELKTSDYYKIEIIPDEAPVVTVHNLPQFTQLPFTGKLSIDLKSTLADDYGIRDAYVIATVSKGSGESVKFREEKLSFTSPSRLQGKNIQALRTIDLLKLGMEPGDELYFYVEAIDNKTPISNRSRTETFFITLLDTASQQLSVEGGLGVDVMPEYFRSQRQIIIDSEKLLRNKKSISKHEFNSRSNELGYDQKVLRLKYGEFLGEEFETVIGPGLENSGEDSHEGEEGQEKDLAARYGHAHDKDNEHNLVPEKKQQSANDHHHENENGANESESIADAYKHQHDDPEEATFFTQSIRAKLKAALTVMWDAELHLRMYDPQKSLPYQYTALKLLKEISNDSRIYVHKTGFDPPPLKEEKRLSGNLDEVKGSTLHASLENTEVYPSIRRALLMIEPKIRNKEVKTLSAKEKQILREAGRELSGLALEQPGKFLHTLSKIRMIVEDNLSSQETGENLVQVRKALWQALPQGSTLPDPSTHNIHALDNEFINQLEGLKND